MLNKEMNTSDTWAFRRLYIRTGHIIFYRLFSLEIWFVDRILFRLVDYRSSKCWGFNSLYMVIHKLYKDQIHFVHPYSNLDSIQWHTH